MKQYVLIACALGLIAAVAFVSATTGPLPMRLVLFLICPLPLLLAGLGWGTRTAVLAGFAGTVLLLGAAAASFFAVDGTAGAAGAMTAAVFAISQALPATVLAYLAMLNRAVTDGNQDPSADAGSVPREWYPPGRLVVWTAILAAVPAIIWSVLADSESTEVKAALSASLEAASKAGAIQAPGGGPWTPDDIARASSLIYSALPGGSAMAWMSGLLLALWIAGRVMKASGQLLRPWPDLAALEFPRGTALAFAAVMLAAVLLEGPAGIAGRAFTGALLLAYLLLGLAVIHFITRGLKWRPFILWSIYAALLLVNGLACIPILLIGLTDGVLHLRDRFGQTPPST